MIEEKATPSLEELRRERERIEALIARQQEEEKKAALDAIMALIKEKGLDGREVADMLNARSRRKKAPAKYRNPDNPRQTWSGQGNPPDWYVNASNKDALRIRK